MSPKLHILGGISLAGYAAVPFWEASSQAGHVYRFLALFTALFLLYFLALWLCRNPREGQALVSGRALLGWAFLFRLALLPAGAPSEAPWSAVWSDLASRQVAYDRFLLYDQDIWRYLWDGHVAAMGHDPYARTPAEWARLADEGDPAAAALFGDERWEDIHFNLAYEDYATVYPPLAQLFFRLVHAAAPGGVFVFKLLVALLDLGVCWLLLRALRVLGKPAALALVYAWNPLVVKEYAGSGHLDPLMLFFLTAAVCFTLEGKRGAGLLCLGLSAAAKLTPLVLAPLFLRRTPWRLWPLAGAPIAASAALYWRSMPDMLAALSTFAQEWVFNPGLWAVVHEALAQSGAPAQWANAFCGLVFLAIWAAILARDRGGAAELAPRGFAILAALLLLSAAVMPWYLPWALPLAAMARIWSWPALTLLSLLTYLFYIGRDGLGWLPWVEYGVFFAILAWEWRRRAAGAAGLAS